MIPFLNTFDAGRLLCNRVLRYEFPLQTSVAGVSMPVPSVGSSAGCKNRTSANANSNVHIFE